MPIETSLWNKNIYDFKNIKNIVNLKKNHQAFN